MFKNLFVFRLGAEGAVDLSAFEDALSAARFVPCGATQPRSMGWVPARGKPQGPLVESVGGQWLLKLAVEQRVLPGSVVKRRVDEMAAQIEQASGRQPGKREKRELKEQALLELLPQAFTRISTVGVWLDPKRRLLMIDAASAARADEVVVLLVKAVGGLRVAPLQTTLSAAAAMSDWLVSGEPPAVFSVDRECELKSSDDTQAVVRYARHALDIEEVRQHIAGGKRPTRLAITWNGRVSLLLTETMQLRKIDFLDVVMEDRPGVADADEAFDADAALATGELARLIPDLVEALGGEGAPAA